MTSRASYSVSVGFGALSFALIALVSIVSGIALARLYGLAVVGQFALVVAPVNLVVLLSSARERPAFVRELAVLEPRAPRCTALFAAILAFSFGLTAAVALIALPVVYVVYSGPIDHPELFAPTAVSLAGYTLIANTGWNLDAIFAAFQAGRQLFWIRLHQAVIFLVLAIALNSTFHDVWGPVIATIAASTTSLVHRVVAVREFMALTAPRSELRDGFRTLPELIRFGLKIVPGALATGACTEIGTWVIGLTGGVTRLGAYSRAWAVASRFIEINWRIVEMLFPTLVVRRSSGDHAGFDRAVVDTMRYCAGALLMPAAVGGGAATSVMALYGQGFVSAATALAVLLAVPAGLALSSVQRQVLFAADRPWISSVVAGVRLSLTVVATIVMTLRFGITGTALGLLIPVIAEVLWLALLTVRHLHTPMRVLWPPRERPALVLAYAAGFAAARAVVSVVPGIVGLLPALIAGVLAYGAALMAAGGVNERDRARAASAVNRLRRRSRVAAASHS